MANGCPNQATYAVMTMFGTYKMCSKCIQNGHMLVNDPDYLKAPRFPLGNQIHSCECEHRIHIRDGN